VRNDGDRCPENLLARSRRGPLSPVERRALDAHLGVCGLCRAAVALGALTDDLPDLPSDDDGAVVARLATRVAPRGSRRPARARPIALAAGLALMAVAGAAAAWIAARRPPAVSPPQASAAPAARRAVPEIAPMPPPAAPVPARPASEGHRRRATEHVAAIPPPPAVEAPSADRLFAEANAARGAGDLRTAASRYELLERQYPDSPEASVSLVSAGDLLARLDQPAAALERFDRYLAGNARGPLAPEALFGRARCLRELGRAADEAGAWRALRERFPGSLYDRTARRRLDELRADGPAP
jgi:TolA-binding protein